MHRVATAGPALGRSGPHVGSIASGSFITTALKNGAQLDVQKGGRASTNHGPTLQSRWRINGLTPAALEFGSLGGTTKADLPAVPTS